MNLTRRDIGKLALAALPTANLLAKPNSKFGGVQIGINAPYSYQKMQATAEEVLQITTDLGISAVELRTQPVEASLGAPKVPGGVPRGTTTATPEQKAGMEVLNKWRLSLSMDKVKAIRKLYEDAGVMIQIVKVDAIDTLPPEVIDYFFTVAKTLGGKALSTEIPLSKTQMLGEFATKHKMMVGYHGHGATKPEHWETAFSLAKYNGAQV